MTNAAAPDGVPPPLPMDPVERVFPVARVCSVTTPDGAGHGILCTLKGAPCVLTPAHVLGEAEDAPGCFDRRDARVAAARRARVFVAHRADPLAAAATVTRLRLLPEVFFAFSAAPAPGRPPDANRMDYALVACDAELPDAPFDASSDAASDAVSASRRADAKKRLRSFLFTRALEEARPSETCEPGDELHLGACDGGAERASGVAWRRGFVTAPPRGARRDDEARAATATTTVPLAREPPPDTRERSLRTTRVSLRYDARTTSGESGAAVTSAPRRAPGELDADFAARRKAAHLEGARGRGALVAMHRAGGDGEDGEGVMVCEILKDVKETLAAGKVRDAAGEGNAAVAVAELAREPRAASRGARSRAAAAAAEVVASLPEQAVQAMASWIDRGGYVAVGPARVAAAAEALEQALCDWVAFDPRSARLAASAAHALGALARARMRPARGGGAGDACVIETLDRHYANEAVREKARWAHRVRSAGKAR